MRLHDLFEAKTAPLPTPVDTRALLERLKAVAGKLVHYPYDLDWDFSWGNNLKTKVLAVLADINKDADEEDFTAPVEADHWIEELPAVWKALALHTFSKVKSEVTELEHDYQARHGARMDHEAGYSDPMHYVESSDWLSAMQLQDRMGAALDRAISNVGQLEHMIKVMEDFTTEWLANYKTEAGDEPILTEAMRDGLRAAIPMLMLVLKKIS